MVDGVLDGIGETGDLLGHAGSRQQGVVIRLHVKAHARILHTCIVKPLFQIFRTLPCGNNARCFVCCSHVDAFDPHLHQVFLFIGKGYSAFCVNDHLLIQDQPGFILGDNRGIGYARHNEFAVLLFHKRRTPLLEELHSSGGDTAEGSLLSSGKAEERGHPVRADGIHQNRKALHGIDPCSLHLLVSCKTHPLEFTASGLIQLHIRYDAEPDRMIKLIFVIARIQIGQKSWKIAGFYHQIQRRIGDQKLGLHPLLFHLILVKKRLHSEDLLDQRFYCLHKIIFALFIKFQIMVVIFYLDFPVHRTLHGRAQRTEGADHQIPYIVGRILIQCVVILPESLHQAGIDLIVHNGKLCALLLLHLQNLQFPVLAHTQKSCFKILSALAVCALSQQKAGLDILDRKRKHCQYIVVILTCLLKLVIQLISDIQPFGVLFLQFHIFPIGILDLSADLTDIFHDFFRRYHIQYLSELELHVHESLCSLGIQKGNQHVQKIIFLIDRNLRDTALRNIFRLDQAVLNGTGGSIAPGIDCWCKFFQEFLKTSDCQNFIDLFHLVVIQTRPASDIPDQGKQVQALRIDFGKQHRSVCLCDSFHMHCSFFFL